MTAWGREHKAAYPAAQQDRKAGSQECLTLCIKQQSVAGLKSAIQQMIKSKYASLTTWAILLKAAREAEIAVSTGPDKEIMEIEVELSAIRLAQGAGRGASLGHGGAGLGQGSSGGGGQGSQASQHNPGSGALSHKQWPFQVRWNLGNFFYLGIPIHSSFPSQLIGRVTHN